MTTAILGSSGFVGSSLARLVPADEHHSSKTIQQIRGRSFQTIYVACAPGAKWLANKEPDQDAAAIDSIIDHLRTVEVEHCVLISTVDVYPKPIDVDERTVINPAEGHPYGRNRLRLEEEVRRLFRSVSILRLPGLFGPGLKKNVIFDLLTNNQVEKIHPGGVFQFYCMDNIANDIATCRAEGMDLVNISTEPISVRELASHAFGIDLPDDPGFPPARYDFKSIHADRWSGDRGYLYTKDDVLAEMRSFVLNERERWR